MIGRITAAPAAVAVALVVSACGSAEPLPTESTGSSERATLNVGGEKQTLDGELACSDHSGGFAIEIGNGPAGVFVVLRPGVKDQVASVDLGNSTGIALVSENARVRSAGDVHVVTGDAVPATNRDSTDTKPFELRVDCSH